MKKQVTVIYLFVFSLLLTLNSCKKDAAPADNSDQVKVHAEDQARFSSEVDAVANDANIAVESSSNFTGRFMDVQGIICDATVAIDVNSSPRTITITYDGTTCPGANRTRTGVVVLSMAQGIQWKNAGAAINVTYQNLKITRISDNKSITINGTQTYTNVSGGLLINLPTLGTITHTITSDGLSITFDNGSQRNWKVAKQRVFTYSAGLVISSTGTHTDGANTNIAEWGTNRFGGSFATSTTAPIVVRQDCNGRITSGGVKHVNPVSTTIVTFGLDVNGNATTCPGTGNYYYKLVWTGTNGNTVSVILPY